MILNPLSGLFPTAQPGAANKTLTGAQVILDAATRQPGEFKKTTPAAINVRATLDKANGEANRQVIIRSAINRLEGIRAGLITPQEEWETTGGYLMLTGQPFKIKVAGTGAIIIDAQVESKLDEYADSQKEKIRAAIDAMTPLYQKYDFVKKKEEFRTELKFATLQTVQLDNHYPAQEQWEKDYNFYKLMGIPVKIQLDSNGLLTAVNQLEADFKEVENIDQRIKLQLAAKKLQNIRDGISSASEPWEYLALGHQAHQDDYFLYINDAGDVDISRNKNANHLIPDFLLESDDDKIETSFQWQKDALEFYAAEKPFHFDFDYQGTLKAVENTFLSVSGLLSPTNKSDAILEARLNLLA